MMKHLAAALVAAVLLPASALAADKPCLRSDSIKHLDMAGADSAVARDDQNRRFTIVFVGPCGARHQNVFFILKPESMPVCLGPGTGIATNSAGVCVVKSVTAQQ